jgi:uncharacterized protein (DUF2141 family)
MRFDHRNVRLAAAGFASMLALFGVVAASVATAGSPVTVDLRGLRDRSGDILVALCSSAPYNARASCEVTQRFPAARLNGPFILQAPGPGRYALLILHDENANGKLDTNLVGMPTEAYGFSNNPSKRPGRPSFAEAAFEVGNEPIRLRIELVHWP